MASEVQICNRALQKLGAKRITSLTEDSTNARACNVAYESVRDALLRSYVWSCATKRAELAADSEAPDWGRANAFQLPSDYIRLADPYPEDNHNNHDWVIEGKKIYTDDSAPIYVRYVYRVTDPNEMDALFQEALSAKLAYEICEEITQSNSKKESLGGDFDKSIKEAKRVGAIEKVASQPPEDSWVTVRQ